MLPPPFIGRKSELEKLHALHQRLLPSLVVLKGRRRIGKSRCIAEFAAQLKTLSTPQRPIQCTDPFTVSEPPKFPPTGSPHPFGKNRLWTFTGLAPQTGMTAQMQRDHFAKQLTSFLQDLQPPPLFTSTLVFQDWTDAWNHLSLYLQMGDIVLFDEISWMGSHDPTFIPKLKAWWDRQRLPIVMVLCGSVSTWIEENILKSTAFFGRIHLTLTLQPLSIPESAHLLASLGFQGSSYDTLKLISIMGGVPWYLEQVYPGGSADQMIQQLCFEKDSLLLLEFDRIFHDLFNGKGSIYKKILEALLSGMKTLADIRQDLHLDHSGTLSQLMDQLRIAGFVEKQPLWSFKTTQPLKQSLYRISDPYLRFYLKVIEGYREKINLGTFNPLPLAHLPGFDAHLGLQMETLLLQNRSLLLQSLGIIPSDVLWNGPYRQFQTERKKGCQIDYLVQTATHNLFVCEFKFKRRELGSEVIQAMQEKIKALTVPKGYAPVPVLFHLGGVSTTVEMSRYFYRIIDIADFL